MVHNFIPKNEVNLSGSQEVPSMRMGPLCGHQKMMTGYMEQLNSHLQLISKLVPGTDLFPFFTFRSDLPAD